MLGYQVADDGVSHCLRGLNASLAVALDFDDVTLLACQLSGDVVKIRLCLGAEGGASRDEGYVGRSDGLILIEVGDGSVERRGAVAGCAGELG